ncbi:MAG: aminotransferase class I/II-fold pyridoxal phosphate-dependent enzyme, partial [Pseudomonadota bacterium]
SPTYNEHAAALTAQGWRVNAITDLQDAGGHDLVTLVNPNNPDGRRWSPEDVLALSSRVGLLVVDESFADTEEDRSIASHINAKEDRIVVLRSFGKFFGLAGLRLGFAISAREIADQMVKAFGPWSVSGPALAIGLQALSDQTWILGMRSKVEKQSLKQADQISSCGLNLVANTCLFMEFEAEDGIELSQSLMSEHILVRSFPDRPNRLRFGLCKDDFELDKLASALKKHV